MSEYRTPSSQERTEKNLVFHYDREERLRMKKGGSTEPQRPGLFGFLRRNKTLTIVMLDVSLAILVFLLYWFFLRPDLSVELAGGYRYELRAVRFAEEVLVSLSVESVDEQRAGDLITVSYLTEEGDELLSERDVLPGDARQVLRSQLPNIEGNILQARIEDGELSFVLETTIQSE